MLFTGKKIGVGISIEETRGVKKIPIMDFRAEVGGKFTVSINLKAREGIVLGIHKHHL